MSSYRPVVLVFNKVYLPGFKSGGPVRTISNLVARLGDVYDFRVVTLDRDSGDNLPYSGVDLGNWNTVGKARVRYLRRTDVSLHALQAIIDEVSPERIYLNSFFDPIFTQRILVLRWLRRLGSVRTVVAVRGELSKGALGLKSAKKKAFIWLARSLKLYRGVLWQVSSEHERADLIGMFGALPPESIRIATNLAPASPVALPHPYSRSRGEPLKVCFLSRLVPMKNLLFALDVLAHVEAEVEFTIYGPIEDQPYWARCLGMMAELPDRIRTTYGGPVPNEMVRETLAGHDLFFLPTRGENYGHAIHEALSAGLPVLISDRTPWRDLEDNRVGWACPLERPEEFATIIDSVAGWPASELEAARARTARYAQGKSEDPAVMEANRLLFADDASYCLLERR